MKRTIQVRKPSASTHRPTTPKAPSREPTARGLNTPHQVPTLNPTFTTTLTTLFLLLLAATRAPAQQPQPEPSGLALATAIEQTLVDVIARTEKSIVAIARVRAASNQLRAGVLAPRLPGRGVGRTFLPSTATDPRDPDFIPSEYGTGVVIDAAGLILTQYHVLDVKDEHWVTTVDRKVYRATIKAADPRSGLAVLSIPATDLVPIRLGNAATVRKGQIVITLGNPYAIARDGQASASWGIVANIARKAGPLPKGLTIDGVPIPAKPTLHHFGTLIQTDAKLNLGTSGGALVNLRGEMIGLTTSLAALAGYEQAAGYAVPISEPIRRVIDILKEGREVEHGLLGVSWRINYVQMPSGEPREGVAVETVLRGAPAHRAGLRSGDVITHVNDQPVGDNDSLMLEVGQLLAGSTVRLRYRRGLPTHDVELRLAKFPVVGTIIATRRRPSWRGLQIDYATSSVDYFNHVNRGEIDDQGCVLITDVREGSPAWQQGLRPKMFVSHVEDIRVTDPAEFYQAIADQQGPVRLRLSQTTGQQQPDHTIPPESSTGTGGEQR